MVTFIRRTTAVALAGLLASFGAPALAAGEPPTACEGRTDVLGVSRIVEVDTGLGPRFGAQYRQASFLEDGEVVLTFDDGPLRHYTQRVLDALERECTRATFFVVGRMAVADPDMVKEMARRGHTVGVHTWSHKKLPSISTTGGVDEIELGLSATAKALGSPAAPFFRFPYLADTKAALGHLASRQLGVFGIDVDSRDFDTRSPAEMQQTVLRQLAARRKGIILFHDIQPSTANGLRSLLAELRKRGFKVVHAVPKAPAATLAEYDTKAGEELARRVVAAARNPLASRSAVWPNAKHTTGGAGPALAASEEEVLPWLKGTSTEGISTPKAPAPRPSKRPPPPEEDPWQIRTMGN